MIAGLSTFTFALVLCTMFMLVHLTLLRYWLDASIKISFLVSLLTDLKFIRIFVAEASFSLLLCSDFLEQFILIVSSLSFILLGLYIYFTVLTVIFSDFSNSFLLFVLRGILTSYSTLEFLFLRKFTLFFLSSLIIIFIFNMIGMLPLSFTFTSSLCVPFFFGITTFFLWFFLTFLFAPAKSMNFFLHKGTNFFIAPLITLIEIVSNLSKFVSLSVRLFANMFAGHLLLKAFYSFIYILFFNITLTNAIFGIFVLAFTFFIIALEFLIAFLQAYVALLLIVLYISGVRTFSRAH